MADEVTIEEDGPLLFIGVNRPDAHNLWNLEVIRAVCRACKRLADAEHLRVGVIFGHGRHFTAGLDLAPQPLEVNYHFRSGLATQSAVFFERL